VPVNATSRPLRFYLDYVSHNAYLAWTQLPALTKKHNLRLEIVPVLFAGLLEANHQLGPAEVPPKLRWMLSNTLRKAALLGIPLNPPAFHPFNPLPALRATSLDMPDSQRRALVDALFRATWAEGRNVADPLVVASVAAEAGLKGRDVIAECGNDEIKSRVRQQTEDAIAAGVFGVPTMCIDDELFWGYDDFPYLERFLAGEDPIMPGQREAWTTVRPAAIRTKR
jgi:2-hydroxychromene-2-carboxylate isomerase